MTVTRFLLRALAFAVFAAGLVRAQDPAGAIRGSVTDKDFDGPLTGAQVTVVETNQKATTTDQGSFVVNQVPPGKYTLTFTKEGYARQVKTDVIVRPAALTDLDVALAGEFTDMEEFVVQDIQLGAGTESGLLKLRLESPALLDSISADLMSRAGAGDAASALRLVAGATVQDGKYAVVRGLPDRYVVSQMNGVRLPTADANKRAVQLDQFPSAIIESIQVSKTFTPDQQGDASGGAVDVRLKGIPDEPFYARFSSQVSRNSQVGGRRNFLTYEDGGLNFFGFDDGSREIPAGDIGGNFDRSVGTSRNDAPTDYKWSVSTGLKEELGSGVKIGGALNFFYERDSSFFDHGRDDSYWVTSPGNGMTPRTSQGTPEQGDFKTALFDVTQGSQLVQWGGLGTFGAEIENHSINLTYLYTRTATDTATLAEDTRGKAYFFPGYDPANQTSPGQESPNAAPYLRLETLNYTEREADTLQLHGKHRFPLKDVGVDDLFALKSIDVDWTAAWSTSTLDQPDKRQFGELWYPGATVGTLVIPPVHLPFKPAANFTLGNLQHIWQRVEEESAQYQVNLGVPFRAWTEDDGRFSFGFFTDQVDRGFNQDTFSNFNDSSAFFYGGFDELWSGAFPAENHPITESLSDVDYTGKQSITAWYSMLELPLVPDLKLVGGVRLESTEIGITNAPEQDATWFPPGAAAATELNPGDADVSFSQDDVLPSIALEYKPWTEVTLRGAYNKTFARQTFKELTPIIQQEFLGGPIFIGNPELQMSAVKNYDLRADYAPYEGGLVSASWFRKDIKAPIEYVQRVVSFDYTTAVNYPKGELMGFEFELRQDLGRFLDPFAGLSIGANATFISSEVHLPEDEIAGFNLPNIQAPITSRDMTGAPDHLYNVYLTYDLAETNTQFALFYTITGDTLIAGAGQAAGNFIPSVYAREFGTLNASVTQKFTDWLKLQVQVKNITNPDIETVYRSKFIGDDVLKTSSSRGVEYSITLSAEFRF